MAEIWGAAIAGAAISGGAAYAASKKQAGAASRGANAANAELARQYDQTREDFAPQRELGYGAINALARLYGFNVRSQAQRQAQADVLLGDTYLPYGATAVSPGNKRGSDIMFNGRKIGRVVPGGANGRFVADPGVDINALALENEQQQAATGPAPAGPDMGAFFESPDYQFNLAEGQKAIDRSLAARGRALSGAGLKEGQRFASGLASQQYGDFTSRLMQIAGLGSAATSNAAGIGANLSGQIAQNSVNAGNARGSAYAQGLAGVNNAVQGGLQNYMLYRYLQPSTPPMSTPPIAG